jgi:hypothetical protein
MNAILELELREAWELQTSMHRLALRGIRGPKPKFKMNKANSAIVRKKGKGGID